MKKRKKKPATDNSKKNLGATVWGQEVHDEVLARLFDLNQERSQAEILSDKTIQKKTNTKASKEKITKTKSQNFVENIPIILGFDVENRL